MSSNGLKEKATDAAMLFRLGAPIINGIDGVLEIAAELAMELRLGATITGNGIA